MGCYTAMAKSCCIPLLSNSIQPFMQNANNFHSCLHTYYAVYRHRKQKFKFRTQLLKDTNKKFKSDALYQCFLLLFDFISKYLFPNAMGFRKRTLQENIKYINYVHKDIFQFANFLLIMKLLKVITVLFLKTSRFYNFDPSF